MHLGFHGVQKKTRRLARRCRIRGGAVLGSTGRDRPAASCPGTAAVGARRGRGRRTAAPAQHPRRAVVAPPLRREEEGAWRRMRVAAVPCALAWWAGASSVGERWRRSRTRGRGGVEGVGELSAGWEASGVRGMWIFFFARPCIGARTRERNRQDDGPTLECCTKKYPCFVLFSCRRS